MLVSEKPPLNEEMLEHFGVKGMKWGVRNKRKLTPREKADRNRKFVTSVALGSAFAGVILSGKRAGIVIR